MRLKADVGGMEWQGAPLVHPEAAGGCEARERGRVGSTKVVVGQVLGGDEISSGIREAEKCFCFRLPLCVWAFGG